MGARNFTILDHDTVDETNLNRMFGMNAKDARDKGRKTDIIAREIKLINRSIKCRKVFGDLLRRENWSKLLDCSILIAATDNHSSRLLLNALSEQYLIPQISVGSIIEV